MALKVVKAELLKSLDDYLAACVADGYKIGLFQNDLTPDNDTVIGDVVPASFGGYSGLVALSSFPSATWIDPRAVSQGPDVIWTADGTSSNNIYGSYVVDGSGALAWIDRNATGPLGIGYPGQRYVASPTYTRRSEF